MQGYLRLRASPHPPVLAKWTAESLCSMVPRYLRTAPWALILCRSTVRPSRGSLESSRGSLLSAPQVAVATLTLSSCSLASSASPLRGYLLCPDLSQVTLPASQKTSPLQAAAFSYRLASLLPTALRIGSSGRQTAFKPNCQQWLQAGKEAVLPQPRAVCCFQIRHKLPAVAERQKRGGAVAAEGSEQFVERSSTDCDSGSQTEGEQRTVLKVCILTYRYRVKSDTQPSCCTSQQ